jgi:uncharacterized protein YhbP (UPF0306 family)
VAKYSFLYLPKFLEMDNNLPERMIEFIHEHHILTLATSRDGQPYCTTCFYVYLEKENAFVFTSDAKTRHGEEMTDDDRVAAAIALETKTVGKIRGLQITGNVHIPNKDVEKLARKAYLKAFPYAILKPSELWILKPSYIKMTDNRLGFGKKLIWNA